MYLQTVLLALLATAAATPIIDARQISINQAQVAEFNQRVGDLRAVLQQIAQVTSDASAGVVAGQFNLGDQINRLNSAGGEINGAIDAIQGRLKDVLGQFSGTEDAAGKIAKGIFG
ncbi:hypothetical protein VFPPC_12722 [Pochonia chlamydosporia 170]|uniref:Uncharacterized protein n=1 Tax=Pochonia chlamydosporia 170 TaxID=1380566 RepID=A0A179G2S6_METCM|nr:hypothetical protein VFPPC_12722 [Pochonia chlamydosporia 170]OAQ72175.1 hypothetical protein VFPPC_12722 [Pochonia chlamydosporia 170]